MDNAVEPRTIDPILNLPVQSSVTSLCFLSPTQPHDRSKKRIEAATKGHSKKPDNRHENDTDDSSESDDDDEDDDEIVFRSSAFSVQKSNSVYCQGGLHHVLRNRFLASCHSDGEALLWDLNNQKRVATISSNRGGSGFCVRRIDDPGQMMFQSRDPKGMVSLHSIERCPAGEQGSNTRCIATIIREYETYSQTFCQAAPCYGNKNLMALPTSDESAVTVVDWRSNSNVAKYSIDGHGMVTSLAFTVAPDKTGQGVGKPILACGMESGTAVFFDVTNGSTRPLSVSAFSLGKDPLLTLDAIPSSTATPETVSDLPTGNRSNAVLVAGGMAGDAEDVSQLRKDQAGRTVLFKAVCCNENDDKSPDWSFKQRARLSTCRVDRESFNGKPGVSVCRFRPHDGRLLAIGGWDRRIRLFERSKGKPMAILKGTAGSVADLDWAADSMESGLLASASRDEKLISIWQCYAKS